MDKERYGFKWTDSSETTGFAEISKGSVKECFKEYGLPILNEDGKEDDSYICGDAQFFFGSDGDLEEVIVFPVYERAGSFTNGENFVQAPYEFWDLEEEDKQQLGKGDIER